jgi:glyoxylase-like metal-dependent hydrolase (beta-lactamase superfamily II)
MRGDSMLQEVVKVIRQGDESGNGMVVRIPFPSGLEIIGLATKNFYGGDWDFGPTWNYVVLADKSFLLDTGRVGMGPKLLDMMESSGVSIRDLDFLVLSHGHEDHDGGLCDVAKATRAPVKAHRIYERLIRFHPAKAPADARKDFPASCWHCFMPESFSNRHCLEYHRGRNGLEIETIGDGQGKLSETIQTYHVPGHSPDALTLLVGDDAILVGDTVLPDITPFPTREAFFHQVREILPPEYSSPDSVYGLRAYIRSLKKLDAIARQFPDALMLPAHRLFHNHHWNEFDLGTRVGEIIDHHINRCADILKILKDGPKTAGEVAVKHFSASSLEGAGMLMAENEAVSHCELLGVAGDVRPADDEGFVAPGSENFESTIRALVPD